MGLPLSLVLADCGFHVIGVDISKELLDCLDNGELPISEPGLQELLLNNLNKNFSVVDDIKYAVNNTETVFITVGTSLNNTEANLSSILLVLRQIGKILKKNQLIVLRSTISIGFTENEGRRILEEESNMIAGKDFWLAYSPERTVEGVALNELKTIPKIVSGISETSIERTSKILEKIGPKVIRVSSPKSAEMLKLLDNTSRGLNIAFGNTVGIFCEKLGIDAHEVIKAANTDYPRNKLLIPSPGVGGSCVPKDSVFFMHQMESYGLSGRLIRAASEINNHMPYHTIKLLQSCFDEIGKPVKESKIAIFGLAYKGFPVTDDIRNSPSKIIIEELVKLDAIIVGYDPAVPAKKFTQFDLEKISLEACFEDADAIVIVTNHPAFKKLKIRKYVNKMRHPPILVDGWHLFDPKEIKNLGFIYRGIGVG